MNKYCIKTSELYLDVPLLLKDYFNEATYPWELLPNIKNILNELIKNVPEGYRLLKDDVIVGSNVKIHESAVIIGPCFIDNNVEIRPSAFIRENVFISESCVIGNSSELKNSILLAYTQVPHYNYVGDSILGNHSHLGASAVCSNLRSDKRNVVIHADKEYETSLRKVGSFVGDNVEVGCGSILNPGTIIGPNSMVYPLTLTRGAYKNNQIIKSTYVSVDKE